jgi:hypothetical protein
MTGRTPITAVVTGGRGKDDGKQNTLDPLVLPVGTVCCLIQRMKYATSSILLVFADEQCEKRRHKYVNGVLSSFSFDAFLSCSQVLYYIKSRWLNYVLARDDVTNFTAIFSVRREYCKNR